MMKSGNTPKARCDLCPRLCEIAEGHMGICKARSCKNGVIVDDNYGLVSALALDPIEKKPLRRFFPGSMILSVGSYGCNLRCPFCQNHEISMAGKSDLRLKKTTPEELVALAKSLMPRGNIGIAFTYNEPVISFEFVLDTFTLAKSEGLKTVLVTNGTLLEKPLLKLLPLLDAANVDLKGFSDEFYKWVKGDFECVKRFIELSYDRIHLEVTTLVIPGKNDSDEEMEAESSWISSLDKNIPLHLSRYFPRYKCAESTEITPLETLLRLQTIASRHLKYVYTGNI